MEQLTVIFVLCFSIAVTQSFVLKENVKSEPASHHRQIHKRSSYDIDERTYELAQAIQAIEDDTKYQQQNNRRPSYDDFLQAQTLMDLLGSDKNDGYGNQGYDWPDVEGASEEYYDNDGDYYGDYVDGYENMPRVSEQDYDREDYDTQEANNMDGLPEVSDEEVSDMLASESAEDSQEEGEGQDMDQSEPASSEELENIFSQGSEEDTSTQAEKKEVNWAPHVLGMAGSKRSHDNTVEEAGEGDTVAYEQKHGHVRPLSQHEMEKLFSSAKAAEIKSINKEVEVTNVNGKSVAKEIEDILTEDENGEPDEIIVEHKLSPEEAEEMSDNAIQNQQETMAAAEQEMDENLQKMAALTREVLSQFPDITSDREYSIKKKRSDIQTKGQMSKSDLAKECLLRYVMLEDEENTDLAEALDWASRAQYEDNKEYIPKQIDFLRKAVYREEMLQQLQEDCMELLGIDDLSLGQREQRSQEHQDRVPMYDPSIEEGRPRKRNGEYIPSADDFNQITDQSQDKFGSNKIATNIEEAYTEYLAEQLQEYLNKQKEQMEMEPSDEPEEIWYDRPMQYTDDDSQQDLMLNPLLRHLVEKYQRTSGDQLLPGYGDELEDFTEDIEEEDEGMCEPLGDLLDDCAYARALGWVLDDQAMALCNRHQLCYECGDAHGINADHCDFGYQVEAYRDCDEEEDQRECISQADALYELMSKVHMPVYDTRLECNAPCVEDFITGDYFKK